MAISDYLNNIPAGAWVQGTMNTVSFYKEKINGSALKDNYFFTQIPSLKDVRFGSWYMGKRENPPSNVSYACMGTALENSPTDVPAIYASSLQLPYGGFGDRTNVFANDVLLHKQYYDLTGKKIVAYIEPVLMSAVLDGTNNGFTRTYPVIGGNFDNEYSQLFGAYGCFPYVDESTLNTSTGKCSYLFDDTILSLYTVKTLKYYAVNSDGTREEIKGFSPTMPIVISGKPVAQTSSVLPSTFLKTLTLSQPKGILQLCLPNGSTDTNLKYPFAAGNSSPGWNTVFTGNNGNRSLNSRITAFVPWLQSFDDIGESENVTLTKHSNACWIFEIADPSSIYCKYNIQFVNRVAKTALASGAYYLKMRGNRLLAKSADYLFAAAGTPQDFIDVFNDWGIYATTSLDEALYGEIPDLVPQNPAGGESGLNPDLPSSGIPENNIPDLSKIPNDPTNKIDDFPVTSPILTQANLCDSYIYNHSQVRELFKWFCSEGYINNQSELFADKLSAIYGLMLYPIDLVSHDNAHVRATDKTTIVSVSENISGYVLGDGYNTIINGGEISYLSYYGNFADWNMCKYSLYVPYGGVVEIPPSVVVNRKLTVQYALDLMTGKATCVIKSYSLANSDLGVLVKLIPCQIGHIIPVQSSNYGQREISNTLSAISMGTTALNTTVGAIISGVSGHGAGVASSIVGGVSSLINQGANMAFGQQLSYCATGAMSPSTGLSLPQTPFLSISRAYLVKPDRYRDFDGLPTHYYSSLSSLSTGNNFVKCENVKLDTVRATSYEINEIRALLSNGVYI